MIIGIITDSHDNVWNLKKVVDILNEEQVDLVIHCGDFIAPFSVRELGQLKCPVHCVFGNNDGDRYEITRTVRDKVSNVTLHGELGEIDAETCKIGFTHLPTVAMGLASMRKYAAVFCGHTHKPSTERVEGTLLVNAGQVMGRQGQPNYCLFDTVTREVKVVEFK
jgi:hypothetical protein